MENLPNPQVEEIKRKKRPWWFWAGAALVGLFLLMVVATVANLVTTAGGMKASDTLGEVMMERAKSAQNAPMATYSTEMESRSGAMVSDAAKESLASPTATTAAFSLETWGRKLIFSANIGLEAEDVRAAFNRIQVVAAAEGAQVTAANLEAGPEPEDEEDERTSGYGHATVVLRMPQSQFHVVRNRLLIAAGDMKARIVRDSVSTSDVTEEYVDLKARLKHWRAQEVQYLEILRQARKIADIIQATERVASVQQEIERLEGRLRFLEDRVDLSTISVEIYGKGKAPEKPSIAATFKQAGKDIKKAWNKSVLDMAKIIAVIITLVVRLLPFAIIGLIVWGFVRMLRKKAAKETA